MEKINTVQCFSDEQREKMIVSIQALAEALNNVFIEDIDRFIESCKTSLDEEFLTRLNASMATLSKNIGSINFRNLEFSSTTKSLSSICEQQLENYHGEHREEYLQFIRKVQPTFRSIDLGAGYDGSQMDLPSFKEYIKNNPINLPKKTIFNISESLDDYQIELIYEVTQELIQHFSLDEFGALHMENALFHVRYYLNNKLLPRKVQKKLKKFAFRYFLQMLRDSFYYLEIRKVDHIIHELLRDFCYGVDCMYLFEQHVGKEKNYPKDIFASYKAYKLFDDVAKKYASRPMICFLYRKMHEKDSLIYARDTEFRNWFNAQKYLIQLENHTDTYYKTYTEERFITTEIFYKSYGLS